MDIATVIGIVGANATIVMAIVLGGSAGMFINVPSLVIVVGGGWFCWYVYQCTLFSYCGGWNHNGCSDALITE